MLPAVGYISALLVHEADLDELSLALARFALERGSFLCAVYVERPATEPEAFRALIEQVDCAGIRIVVTPSLHHLAPLGAPAVMKNHLEHLLRGEVAVAGYP